MTTRKSLLAYLLEAYEHYRNERQAVQPTAPAPRSPNRLLRLARWLMPNGGTILIVLALIFTQSAWARTLNSPANVPGPSATTINYQGRLADINGVPLDGAYDLSFAIYGSTSGTDLIWPASGPELHTNVPVSSGLFSVGLGSLTAGGVPTTVWDGDRWLEIGVEGETLSPRELIRSVPVAGMALTVPDGAIGSAQIADGAVAQDQAPTLLRAPGDNQRMEAGSVVIQLQPGWQANIGHTAFMSPFGSLPVVTIASVSDNDADNALNIVVSVTANGIDWNAWSAHSSGVRIVTVHWIAVGD